MTDIRRIPGTYDEVVNNSLLNQNKRIRGIERRGSSQNFNVQVIGDGSSTVFSLKHQYNTKNVRVEVRQSAGDCITIIPDEVARTDDSTIRLTFGTAPDTDEYVVIIW